MSFNEYWQAERRRRDVEQAIRALRPEDRDAQQRFTEALRHASLLFPVERIPEGMLQGDLFKGVQGKQVQIRAIKDKNGSLYFPLFTNEEELVAGFGAEQPFLLIAFSPYAQMAIRAEAGVIINPKSEHRAALKPAMLRTLAAKTSGAPGSSQQTRIVPPTRLLTYRELTTLHRWLVEQEEVRQAYLFGLVQQGQPALALGIDVLNPSDRQAMEALARDLHAAFGPILLIPLDPRVATAVTHLPTAIHFDLRE